MRKTAYASKAHEAASRMLNRIARERGDILRYYGTSGKISVANPTAVAGLLPVEFYIATMAMPVPVCATPSVNR